MKVTASQMSKGSFMEMNGEVYQVVKFEHNFHGRGSANLRLKLKSIRTGNTLEETYKPDNMVDKIDVDSIQMSFLYKTGDAFTFVDERSYEQYELPAKVVDDFAPYLKEGQQVYIMLHNDVPIAIRPPASVKLLVKEAEDAVKGDTATNAKKIVTLETGAKVAVPIFIKRGELISVNPETGEYLERA